MWQELMPNLVAEAIGIIVTVLGIDQLLKCRERRRWARIKRQVLTRIRGIFTRLLAQLAVQTNLDTDFMGKHPEISQVDVSELVQSYTREELTTRMVRLDRLQRPTLAAFLQECLSEIRETTNTYNILMEPGLLTKLFSVEETIEGALSRISSLDRISSLAFLGKEGAQGVEDALIDQLARLLVELTLTLLEMDALLAAQIE